MSTFYTVLITVASLLLIKGIVILLFPRLILKTAKYVTKDNQRLRNAALIELFAAIVLFLMAILVK